MARKAKRRPSRPVQQRFRDLPAPRGGGRWHPRHVLAAKLRADGKSWPEVAAELNVRPDTAEHYPARCHGWDDLIAHFQALRLARLQDDLVEPALQALRDVITNGDMNPFARVQAAQIVLSERRAQMKAIDDLTRREQSAAVGGGGRIEVDVTIRGADEDEG